MTDPEDMISPAAIPHCQMCQVKNFAIGGRDRSGNFFRIYNAENPIEKIGKIAWCGTYGPEHLLRIFRIICKPVEVDGEIQSLCDRCARKAVSLQRQEAAA